MIEALPEKSERGGWPIRARARVAYETTLRPETLDKLKVPANYSKGAKTIILDSDDDKEAYGREVPLSLKARAALDSCCPDVGLIFGKRYLNRHAKAAAEKVLPKNKAKVFCFQHFRSAGITHLLERTGNLPGVMYIAGHKHAATTSKYVRPSLRAAEQVVGIVSGDQTRKGRK